MGLWLAVDGDVFLLLFRLVRCVPFYIQGSLREQSSPLAPRR